MPTTRHDIITEATELNQKCETIKEELERQIGLTEKKLRMLEKRGSRSKKARKRLMRFIEDKREKFETIQEMRTILLSIIQDNTYLTDDMIQAMFSEGIRKEITELIESHSKHIQRKVANASTKESRRVKGLKKQEKKRRKDKRKRGRGRKEKKNK